jgi:hypothetical protein
MGKCVHCLQDPVEINSDHVFPVSWYPTTTPPDLEKWQIPSCVPCNSAYGKIEEDFKQRIALCLDPSASASAGIVPGAMRAIDPSAGRDAHDQQKRAGRRRQVQAMILTGDAIPTEGVLPGFEANENLSPEDRAVVQIPRSYVERIAEKIVRGIMFIEHDCKFIEPPFKVGTYVLSDKDAAEIRSTFPKPLTEYHRGPGIAVRTAVASDNGISSYFEIELWQRFKVYASVTDKEDAKTADAA